jgi:hypothetical protein
MASIVKAGAALLVLGLLASFAGGCGDLTSGELDRGIGTLESAAAEGAMVAGQVAEDRTKTTFARVRARELSDDVDHEMEKLADATPAPGQSANRDKALDLAEKVGEALNVIQIYPEDEKRAAEAESDLEGLAELLSKLEDRE